MYSYGEVLKCVNVLVEICVYVDVIVKCERMQTLGKSMECVFFMEC